MRILIPRKIFFIVLSLALILAINTVFRIILFSLNYSLVKDTPINEILYSFFNRGILFDLYISIIIIIIPFLLISIPFLINKKWNVIYKISNYFIITLVLINIAVSASDLVFFKYYNSRITNAIFDWTNDFSSMMKLVITNSSYLPYILLFILVSSLYIYLQHKILRISISIKNLRINIFFRILIFLIAFILLFFGVRGTFNLGHRPLNSDDVYFSDTPFLNQLGFNPVFSLVNSYRGDKISYFNNDNEAINFAIKSLNIRKSKCLNPFQQIIENNDSIKPNIVFIFMESMSNSMVSRYNKADRTTPFLDSIANNGIVFDKFYSAGTHTYNGIFSSLYGLPAIMHNKPLNSLETSNMKFYGLPTILKEKGYTNYFFVTGSKNFDNMNGFLLPNGFNKIISEEDYSKSEIENGWGVSDKVMFNRVLKECDSLYVKNKPFFVNVLTISSHEWYEVPKWCNHNFFHKNYPKKRYEFMDLMMKKFMAKAKTKKWFNNTVFIFVGDHGQNFSPVYDLNLNYHKIPLIIYSPKYIKPAVYSNIGLQIDIYPTVCGLFNFSYINNSLGLDLYKQKRKYAYFGSDNKFAVIDDKYFLLYRSKNNISLYKYVNNSKIDLYNENKLKADSMCNYGFSMLQSAQYIIKNKIAYPSL